MKQPIVLHVNGEDYALEVHPAALLIDVLRDDLGLTGTKECCGIGVCGTCTVLVDGLRISSCLALAVAMSGKAITTIEGLARGTGLDPVQQGFMEEGGFQCGYCTPGMIMAAREFLNQHPDPTEAEIKLGMDGNLCRCTGYYKIIRSIQRAAAIQREQLASAARE